MTVWRRLDHVGLLVSDTDAALRYLGRTLGMKVVEQEELDIPPVRLTHLDAGPVTLQLVEPLPGNTTLGSYLEEHGEGLHHVCFEVDDLVVAVHSLSGGMDPDLIIEGDRRRSAFVPGQLVHGLRLELTQVREESR